MSKAGSLLGSTAVPVVLARRFLVLGWTVPDRWVLPGRGRDESFLQSIAAGANCQQSNYAEHDFRSVAACLCFEQVSNDKQKHPEP